MSGKKSPQTIEVFAFRPDRKPSVGERIGVYWEDDMRFYAGEVASVDQDGKVIVNYDDGETETLNLDEEIWEFPNDPMRYRNHSQRGSESNSDPDKETDESRAENKKDRDSEEKDDEERNVCNGQASASKQGGSKCKRRESQKIQEMDKTQKTPATRRARRTQRVKRAREVQEPGTQQSMEDVRSVEDMQNRRSIENPGHPQNNEDANNAEHIQEDSDTRSTSPLLMKQLLPVKRYTRILKLKKRENRNKDSILEMPFDR